MAQPNNTRKRTKGSGNEKRTPVSERLKARQLNQISSNSKKDKMDTEALPNSAVRKKPVKVNGAPVNRTLRSSSRLRKFSDITSASGNGEEHNGSLDENEDYFEGRIPSVKLRLHQFLSEQNKKKLKRGNESTASEQALTSSINRKRTRSPTSSNNEKDHHTTGPEELGVLRKRHRSDSSSDSSKKNFWRENRYMIDQMVNESLSGSSGTVGDNVQSAESTQQGFRSMLQLVFSRNRINSGTSMLMPILPPPGFQPHFNDEEDDNGQNDENEKDVNQSEKLTSPEGIGNSPTPIIQTSDSCIGSNLSSGFEEIQVCLNSKNADAMNHTGQCEQVLKENQCQIVSEKDELIELCPNEFNSEDRSDMDTTSLVENRALAEQFNDETQFAIHEIPTTTEAACIPIEGLFLYQIIVPPPEFQDNFNAQYDNNMHSDNEINVNQSDLSSGMLIITAPAVINEVEVSSETLTGEEPEGTLSVTVSSSSCSESNSIIIANFEEILVHPDLIDVGTANHTKPAEKVFDDTQANGASQDMVTTNEDEKEMEVNQSEKLTSQEEIEGTLSATVSSSYSCSESNSIAIDEILVHPNSIYVDTENHTKPTEKLFDDAQSVGASQDIVTTNEDEKEMDVNQSEKLTSQEEIEGALSVTVASSYSCSESNSIAIDEEILVHPNSIYTDTGNHTKPTEKLFDDAQSAGASQEMVTTNEDEKEMDVNQSEKLTSQEEIEGTLSVTMASSYSCSESNSIAIDEILVHPNSIFADSGNQTKPAAKVLDDTSQDMVTTHEDEKKNSSYMEIRNIVYGIIDSIVD